MNVVLQKINSLIEDNIENSEFSVDEICANLGMSRSQLHRLIKKQTLLSTTLYIRKIRLEKAKFLLSTTKMRVSEVVDAVGINNHANFSKYFIEEFNVSPTEFRKQIQEQNNVEENLSDDNILNLSKNPFEPTFFQKNISLSRRQSVFAFVILLLLLSTSIYFFVDNKQMEYPQKNENSIAVLPFKNLGSPENTTFCDGIMYQIHSSLSLLENLKVISQTSSSLFKDSQKSIPQIAHELSVKYILEGSFLQIDKQIRITVELINAQDDKSVWTKKYDGNTKNVFAYMSNVAKDVAEELHQKLNTGIANKLDKIPTQNMGAYNYFLEGKSLSQTRTKEKLEASIIKFDNAIKLDPDFADAYTYRASAYFLMGDSKYMDVIESYKMTEKDALKAINLDAENALAYAILANIYRDQNKWEQANTTYKIALKFDPNGALINYWYSLMLRTTGQLDDAIKYSTKAVELDPLDHVILGGHIRNCVSGKRFELAEKSLKNGKLLFDDSWIFCWVNAIFYEAKEDYKTALIFLKKSHELNPNVKVVVNETYFCKAKMGQLKEVNDYLNTLDKTPKNYNTLTVIYAGLNDKERCVEYLQKNAEMGIIPSDLKVSYLYKFLHDDKRFEDILQRFGLLNPAFSTQ